MTKNQEEYIANLEERYISSFEKEKVLPLIRKMKKNDFDFISERKFVSKLGINYNKAKSTDRKVSYQIQKYDEIIGTIKEISEQPIGEAMKMGIFKIANSLLDDAIKFGYCEQASELIKIMKNPGCSGDLSAVEVKDKVLKICEAYGKRMILEDSLEEHYEILNTADQFMVDVHMGEYGKDTAQALTMSEMENALVNATYRKCDTIFKTDGTHELIK